MTTWRGFDGSVLDLGAQPADVDVDDPRVAEVAVAPHPLEQVLARADPPLRERELDEQPELGARQRDRAAPQRDDAVVEPDREVAGLHPSRVGVRSGLDPAQEGPDAGRELLGHEGLGDVVVGPGLEARDDVVAVGAGGDHDDRHPAVVPDPAAHREAVEAGQVEVEEHDVRVVAVHGLESLLAVRGLGDVVPLVLQREAQGPPDPGIVLDEQHTLGHRRIMPPTDRGRAGAARRQAAPRPHRHRSVTRPLPTVTDPCRSGVVPGLPHHAAPRAPTVPATA